MTNFGDLKRFLAEGEPPPPNSFGVLRPSVAAEDADDDRQTAFVEAKTFLKKTLEEHDKTYHPNGYHEGDKCNFRAAMKRNDIVDDLLDEKVKSELKVGLVKFREDGDGEKKIVDVVELEDVEEDLLAKSSETLDEAVVEKYLSAVAAG